MLKQLRNFINKNIMHLHSWEFIYSKSKFLFKNEVYEDDKWETLRYCKECNTYQEYWHRKAHFGWRHLSTGQVKIIENKIKSGEFYFKERNETK